MDRLSVLSDGSVAYKLKWPTKHRSHRVMQPALYYDVTGEPAASWVLGVDPDPDERAPPTDYDVVDPPAPDM